MIDISVRCNICDNEIDCQAFSKSTGEIIILIEPCNNCIEKATDETYHAGYVTKEMKG